MSEFDKLRKIIDGYDVVSFDIFDTLLLRNVQKPVDIFNILEKIVKEKYNIDDFKNIRVQAEENTRTEANSYETTLDEIYEAIDFKNEKIKKEIKEKEILLEKEFLIANPFMKKIYNYCLEKKKKIMCITDMYLPVEVLHEILNDNGYKDIKIYLSCQFHKSKGNMDLYEEAYHAEKIEKKSWLHIGDNEYSDYNQAINFGINAYHYTKVLDRSMIKESDSLAGSILLAVVNNIANNGLDLPYWNKFMILNAFPIYFGFSNWLYNELQNQDNLYFFSKDMTIIQQIFNKLVKSHNKSIKSHAFKIENEIISILNNNKLNYVLDLNKSSTTTKEKDQNYEEKLKITNCLKKENFYNYKKINISDFTTYEFMKDFFIDDDKKVFYGYFFYENSKEDRCKSYIPNLMPSSSKLADVKASIAMYNFLFFELGNPINCENDEFRKNIITAQQEMLYNVLPNLLKYLEYLNNISVVDSIANYQKFIENRNYEDLKVFNKLQFKAGIGEPYVKEVSKFEIENNYQLFLKNAEKYLWPNGYLVEGINSTEDFEKYKNSLNDTHFNWKKIIKRFLKNSKK